LRAPKGLNFRPFQQEFLWATANILESKCYIWRVLKWKW
jgi:hypothetical protein